MCVYRDIDEHMNRPVIQCYLNSGHGLLIKAEDLSWRGMKQRRLRSEEATVKRSGGMTLLVQRIYLSLGCNKFGEQGRNAAVDG